MSRPDPNTAAFGRLQGDLRDGVVRYMEACIAEGGASLETASATVSALLHEAAAVIVELAIAAPLGGGERSAMFGDVARRIPDVMSDALRTVARERSPELLRGTLQ